MRTMIEKKLEKRWGERKKPKWRPFNVKLTAAAFEKICKLVEDGYAGSITEFIRVAVAEKLEKVEQLHQKSTSNEQCQKSTG